MRYFPGPELQLGHRRADAGGLAVHEHFSPRGDGELDQRGCSRIGPRRRRHGGGRTQCRLPRLYRCGLGRLGRLARERRRCGGQLFNRPDGHDCSLLGCWPRRPGGRRPGPDGALRGSRLGWPQRRRRLLRGGFARRNRLGGRPHRRGGRPHRLGCRRDDCRLRAAGRRRRGNVVKRRSTQRQDRDAGECECQTTISQQRRARLRRRA